MLNITYPRGPIVALSGTHVGFDRTQNILFFLYRVGFFS